MAFFISWNVRGLRSNLADLKTLIDNYNPVCLALQETLLKPDSNFSLNRYTTVRNNLIVEGHPHGPFSFLKLTLSIT